MDDFVRMLSDSQKTNRRQNLSIVVATITSTSPLQAEVSPDAFITLNRLHSYSPQVGDLALILSRGAGLYIAIGKVI